MQRFIAKQKAAIKAASFAVGSEIVKYFEMLPDNELKATYREMLADNDPVQKNKRKSGFAKMLLPVVLM